MCAANDNNNEDSASDGIDRSSRFENLLLRLAPLRSLQPDVLEELFFAGLIGNVQIDSVVPYILKMEASEYQSQFGGGQFVFIRSTVLHLFESIITSLTFHM